MPGEGEGFLQGLPTGRSNLNDSHIARSRDAASPKGQRTYNPAPSAVDDQPPKGGDVPGFHRERIRLRKTSHPTDALKLSGKSLNRLMGGHLTPIPHKGESNKMGHNREVVEAP
jgi:hypothetical protein